MTCRLRRPTTHSTTAFAARERETRTDASVVTGNWRIVEGFPAILFESIQLPPMSATVATKVLP